MEELRLGAEVRFSAPLTFSDLAPAMDELGARIRRVKSSRIDARGLAIGGGFDVPLDFVFEAGQAAAQLLVTGLLAELAKDTYRGLRTAILELRKKGRTPEWGDRDISFSLTIGSLWFVFESPLTDEQFVEAVNSAHALAETLPNEELNHPQGTRGRHYNWDEASKSWDGPRVP